MISISIKFHQVSCVMTVIANELFLYHSEISNTTTRATFVMDFQSTSTVTNAILRNQFVDFYTVTATTMSPAAVTGENNSNSTANTTDAEIMQGNKVKFFIVEVSSGQQFKYFKPKSFDKTFWCFK